MKNWSALFLVLLFVACGVSSKIESAQSYLEQGNSIVMDEDKYNYIAKGRAKLALEYFNEAIKLYPKSAEAYNGKGLAYYHMYENEKAVFAFDKAIALKRKYPEAYNNRARAYKKLRNYSAAAEDCMKALKLKENYYQAFHNMGNILSDSKEYELAIKYYDKALDIKPDYLPALSNRAFCKGLAGYYSGSVKDYDKLLEMDSDYHLAWNGRGMSKYRLKNYKEALVDFKRCLTSPQYDPEMEGHRYAYNNIANCYFALDSLEQACKYWQLAIDNGYKYNSEWKATYNIDDPVELVKQHCN